MDIVDTSCASTRRDIRPIVYMATYPITCSFCDCQVGEIQTITFEEDLPSGIHETRKFCSTECFQKYRLRSVQNRRKLTMNQPKPEQPTTTQTTTVPSVVVNNNNCKNTNDIKADSKSTVGSTVKPESESTVPNATNTSQLTVKVGNGNSASVTSSTDAKTLEVSPTTSSVKSNHTEGESESLDSVDKKSVSAKKPPAAKSSKPHGVPKNPYETFSVFEWADYYTDYTPAPVDAFKQSKEPPINEFRSNMKLESADPRNPKSTSIATVMYNIGPRVCLRLDGSDNTNDFYELVDSETIEPIGSCNKRGDMLQPPLGFQKNPSHWPMFMVNTLNGAEIAPNRCFKPTPKDPMNNKFESGMKLEAVDRKNPRLILPATVGDVKGDKILVSFDGWNGAFDYWCDFRSREIFPVGWCKKAGHPLQPPGDKAPTDKEKAKRMSTPGMMKINTGNNKVSPPAPPANGSPGSRRGAAAAALSPNLVSPKSGTKQQDANKVSNNSKVNTSQNGTAKSTTTARKMTAVAISKYTGDKNNLNPKNSGTVSKKSSDNNLMSTKTTARKSCAPAVVRPINGPVNRGLVSVVPSVKAVDGAREVPIRKTGSTLLVPANHLSESDDTDTEVEESPTKQPPAPPQQVRQIQQQQKQMQQSPGAVLTSPTTPTAVAVKRPAEVIRPKLSEIRPKISKMNTTTSPSAVTSLTSGNYPSTPSSPPKVNPLKIQLHGSSPPSINHSNNSNTPKSLLSQSVSTSLPKGPPSSNHQEWEINDVINYLITIDKSFDSKATRDKFHEHEIDGKAFVLLTSEMMMKYMDLKLGPTLKILSIIEKLTGKKVK